ncbi:putative ribonuclease H-like domain-containing protein [Senna tora]|uniref:Putative ribonuclease H-like domain-containing protein n=1 Tax=Senna tora TaxID=362788 RepID=A0A834XGD0_9FABA|nr:putative ribonuclease H-like domain-containing protein [Senna tora]
MKIFENKDCPYKIVSQNALAKVVEFVHLSYFKLNVDGSFMDNPGVMAAAGVIRNHLGHWVSDFSKFIGPGCSLTAELWSLLLGLKLAKDLGINKLPVESDCQQAVYLLDCDNIPITHHLSPLILECRSFPPQFSFCKINHAYREKNRCADSLAIIAIKSMNPFVIYNTVPNELLLLFWVDLSGINYARICKETFDPG